MSAAISDNTGQPRADSLASGVALLLAMTVVQRSVGFVRSVLFCRLLPDDQLGQWSLALGFLVMMAPLAVLGIPGSFGRYVERYRQQGRLRSFLRRTTVASGALAAAAVLSMLLAPRAYAWMIFRDPSQTRATLLLAVALAGVVCFNYLVELLNALRRSRAATVLQFINSFSFAVLGIGLLSLSALGPAAIIVAYTGAAGVAAVCACFALRSVLIDTPRADSDTRAARLWATLAPFAAWVWIINLLTNLFASADRYMILHFGPFDAQQAQGLVGQYHCSRVVPMLLVGVAGMLSGVILPYLSHDWERGDRASVSRTLNLGLKLMGLGYSAAGAVLLVAAPLLFTWLLAGKYDEGLGVLHLTLIYCIWISLATIAQDYLWCAEKARLAGIALAVGLALNIVLNYQLLPLLGLTGAVLATCAANAAALSLIYLLNQRRGMALDKRVWLASALPLVLCLDPVWAAATMAAAVVVCLRSNLLFSADEKRILLGIAAQYARVGKDFVMPARRAAAGP